ncbi:hypothetical protein Rin_00021860 [Candidatus Regiella insecticola 5.15]|uniref:Uncharacterized protein n=1 Tax=Candidatus Regiella insecticola 5.15 TaxID=1005043 RepID=G2H288_9ENTR|nr:hypothetical protein Rin_00021860 [Candidatus Regiella insecticola 5.15]
MSLDHHRHDISNDILPAIDHLGIFYAITQTVFG